jgi:hypothetical protein
MKYKIVQCCVGLSLWGIVATVSWASDATETQILAVLTQMQTQLQSIVNQQTQTTQNFENYIQDQIQRDYPSVPFPDWQNLKLRTIPPSSFTAPAASDLLNQGFSNAKILAPIREALTQQNDAKAMIELNEQLNSIQRNPQLTQVQSQRVTNQLLLLNTKIAYLNYQESIRLESLLAGQLALTANMSKKSEASK